MKLDELKEIWKNETKYETEFNIDIDKTEKYKSYAHKIRNNMLVEFLITWGSILFAVYGVLSFKFFKSYSVYYLIFTLLMMIIPTIYYHLKFYKFFNEFFVKDTNTFQSLIKFSKSMTDFLSNYRTYNYVILILISNFLYSIVKKLDRLKIIIDNKRNEDLEYVVFSLGIFILIFIILEISIYFSYKIHLNKINQIIVELSKDDSEEYSKKQDYIEKQD